MNQITGYTILRELGRGGMATVYLANQLALQRQVALKVMTPSAQAEGAEANFVQRFEREGKLVSQLVHPHIVRMFDAGLVDGVYYIAMEYLPGGALQDRIGRDIDALQAVKITKDIAGALGFAHRLRILHRDIKPHNILFREDGEAVLTDFGIAKAMDGNSMAQNLTVPGLAMGTPASMSPEQIHGKPLDGRADLYSLGVVFYEMLIGRRPFEAPTAMSVVLLQLSAPVPQLPTHFAFAQKVLNRVLAKEPADRYATAEEFIADLTQLEALAAQVKPVTLDATEMLPASEVQREVAKLAASAASPRQRGASTALPPQRGKAAEPTGHRYALWGLLLLSIVLVGLAVVGFLIFSPTSRHDPLADLLSQAQVAMQAERVEQPPGNNALELYRKALVIDPNNAAARKGLAAVAQHYRQRAEQEQHLGDLNAALIWVDKALQVLPLQQDLLAFQTTLEQQREARRSLARSEQDILSLLEPARDDVAAGRLVEPAGKNAADKYQAVIRARPNNAEAKLGLQQIAGEYARSARQQLAQGNLQRALSLVESGLSLVAADPDLVKLQQTIKSQSSGQKPR